MRAALLGVDVVGERVHRLGVAVVPLERDLDLDAVALSVHVQRLRVDHRLVLVDELDEGADPALVVEGAALVVSLVAEDDGDAGVQERELAQPVGERVEAVDGRLEDAAVGLELHLRAAAPGGADPLEAVRRLPPLVALPVDVPVAADLEVQGLGERVDHRHADPVQATRYLVALVVELAAGVQHRHDDLGRGPATVVLVDRYAPPVVDDRHRVVDVDGHLDAVAVPRQGLVDRVVDDLVDQVVQARRAGRPDVHRRPLAHRLEPLENLDLVGAIVVRRPRGGRHRQNALVRNGLATCLIVFELGHSLPLGRPTQGAWTCR